VGCHLSARFLGRSARDLVERLRATPHPPPRTLYMVISREIGDLDLFLYFIRASCRASLLWNGIIRSPLSKLDEHGYLEGQDVGGCGAGGLGLLVADTWSSVERCFVSPGMIFYIKMQIALQRHSCSARDNNQRVYLIPTNLVKHKKRTMEETILNTGITDHGA